MKIFLFLAALSSISCQERDTIIKWLNDVQDFDSFASFMHKIDFDFEKKSKSKRPLVYRVDIMENSGDFNGRKDKDDLPDDFGTIRFQAEEDQNLHSLTGHFQHGFLEGPAILSYVDKSKLFTWFNSNGKNNLNFGPIVKIMSQEQSDETLITSRVEFQDSQWVVTAHEIALYIHKNMTISLPILEKDSKCPILLWDEDRNTFSMEKIKKIHIENGFYFIDQPDEMHEIDIDVPEHFELVNLTTEEYFIVMASLSLLKCRREARPSKTLIKYEDLENDPNVTGPYVKSIEETKLLRQQSILDSGGQESEKCANLLTNVISWPLKGQVESALFPCYEGSGSKWTLWLLQEASGIGTLNSNFFSVKSLFPRGGIFIKTHYRAKSLIQRLWMLLLRPKAVLLQRNPFGAILSFIKHIVKGDPTDPSQIEDKVLDRDVEKINKFAQNEIQRWKRIALDFITLTPDLLVINYEEFVKDPLSQIRTVLRFINVDINEKRIKCIEKYPNTIFRRPKMETAKKTKEFFFEEIKSEIESAILEVQTALDKRSKSNQKSRIENKR